MALTPCPVRPHGPGPLLGAQSSSPFLTEHRTPCYEARSLDRRQHARTLERKGRLVHKDTGKEAGACERGELAVLQALLTLR